MDGAAPLQILGTEAGMCKNPVHFVKSPYTAINYIYGFVLLRLDSDVYLRDRAMSTARIYDKRCYTILDSQVKKEGSWIIVIHR